MRIFNRSRWPSVPIEAVSGTSGLRLNANVKDRKNGLPKDRVPELAQICVIGIDVHDDVLYWSRGCAADDFSGAVVSYGTFPRQPTPYFSHSTATRKLSDLYPACTADEAIERGLAKLLKKLASHPEQIACGLIESGYRPDAIAGAIARAGIPGVFSSRGVGIGPGDRPMQQWDMAVDRAGNKGPDPNAPRWFFRLASKRSVYFDANYWKDFAAARLTQETGAGMWSLYGGDSVNHSIYADHLSSQKPYEMRMGDRVVNVWRTFPGRDDDWFDTFVLMMVAASIAGCRLPEARPLELQPA